MAGISEDVKRRRSRKQMEICDYCYANRVAYHMHRTRMGHAVFVNFIPVDEKHAVCTCSPQTLCLDTTCAYYIYVEE